MLQMLANQKMKEEGFERKISRCYSLTEQSLPTTFDSLDLVQVKTNHHPISTFLSWSVFVIKYQCFSNFLIFLWSGHEVDPSKLTSIFTWYSPWWLMIVIQDTGLTPSPGPGRFTPSLPSQYQACVHYQMLSTSAQYPLPYLRPVFSIQY